MDPYIHDEQANPLLELPQVGEADSNDDMVVGYKMKALLYQETIRDLYEKSDLIPRIKLPTGTWVDLDLPPQLEFMRRTVAHELLHTAGLAHDFAIMCYFNMFQDVPIGAELHDAQVVRLRNLEVPHKNNEAATCTP